MACNPAWISPAATSFAACSKYIASSAVDNCDFVFSSRYAKGGGSEDDTILTYVGNKFFTALCNILFKLKLSDVLYTYVMGSTESFKSLNLSYKDFSFCVEFPIKAKLKNFNITNSASRERCRIAGKKKVNELKDGFLILMSIIKLFIFKKWKKKLH
mgnify:CR=1 FL=1